MSGSTRLSVAMEAVLLTVVALSPWAYGGAHSGFEFLIDVGIALLLALWGARMLSESRLTWRACPVAACLAALFLYGLLQLAPFSPERLASIAPSTARIFQQTLPVEKEVLPSNLSRDPITPPPGTTLSFYPTATRRQLIRLLAVFLLFVVVQNQLATYAALRRLAFVAVINGALLTLLGFLQFFTSPPNTLYWSYATAGSVFGPFINRNHFAMYINLGIGLGLGLLIDETKSKKQQYSVAGIFERPAVLWIILALSLMVSGVAFSLSRGGLIALGAGLGLCAAMVVIRSGQVVRLMPAVLGIAGAIALSAWFGFSRVEARLSTLWGENAEDTRTSIWLTACRIVRDFPIWGTGYGTFATVEPMYRSEAMRVGVLGVHAHNEFLEAASDGGMIRLAITLTAVVFVLYLGFRCQRKKDAPAGLLLGALTAYAMFVMHSFVEFGVHIPAITVLVTTVVAHLVSQPTAEQENEMQFGGLLSWVGAVSVVVLGLVLVNEGWRRHRLDWSLYLAQRLTDSTTLADQIRITDLLRNASRVAPHDVRVHLERAKADFQIIDLKEQLGTYTDAELNHDHLQPALRSLLHARDCCPLLAEPHILLALHCDSFQKADSRKAYLQRVKLLAPTDPDVWYLCGQQELLLDDAPEEAWRSWRRSLELGDRRLAEILAASAEHLTPAEMLTHLMPDKPNILMAAATRLFSSPETVSQRQPFLERAATLIETQTAAPTPSDLRTAGQLYARLGQSDKALRAYEAALAEEPLQYEWRFEFAKLYFDLDRLQEAKRELGLILGQQPNYAAAVALNDEVARAIAEGRAK